MIKKIIVNGVGNMIVEIIKNIEIYGGVMIKQFKRDLKQNSNKLHLDKYYTSDELAQYCVNKTKEIINNPNIKFLEPSAGNGVFLKYLPSDTIAYDIEPESDNIIKQDYLTLDLPYNENLCVIGNPPYGSRLNLAKAFCNKSFEIAEYVSFILPISQLNNTQSIYKYDLIYSEDLKEQEYSDRKVHCCLNIYKRNASREYNKLIRYKDSEIIEIREVIKNNNPKRNRELGDFKYDIKMSAWGNIGCFLSEDEGYAKTFYIKIHKQEYKDKIIQLLKDAKWQEIYPMTAVPNLLQWQVYKYIEDNFSI